MLLHRTSTTVLHNTAYISKKPLVSIITVVYNGAAHLQQTIESVLGQTYAPIEYVIVDGASTDGSVAIIKNYAHRLQWWCSEKDSGISEAFNKALQHCRGAIIGIINSDDWYEPNAVQQAVNALTAADAVYGWMQLHKANKIKLIKGNHTLLHKKMSVPHPTLFIKKGVYERVGYFDEGLQYAMDYDLMLRMQQAGCRIQYLPVTIAHMRSGGRSNRHWFAATKEAMVVRKRYLPNRPLQNNFAFFQEVILIGTKKLFGRL